MAYGVISNGVVTSDDGATRQNSCIATDFSAKGLDRGRNRFVVVGQPGFLGPRTIYNTRQKQTSLQIDLFTAHKTMTYLFFLD